MTNLYPPQPTPKRKPRKGRVILAVALGILALFIGVGIVNSPDAGDARAVGQAPTTPAPGGLSVETWTVPVTDINPELRATPSDEFSDGVYEIGTGEGQIPPGKYRSDGPTSSMTYYATLKNNDGELGDIVDQKVSEGPLTVVVPKPGKVHWVDIRDGTFRKIG